MFALTIAGPRDVQAVEIDRPQIRAPGDALVRVTTTSISTRDLERYLGASPGSPVTPGGGCVGVVDETGAGVSRFRLDDVVLVPPAVTTHGGTAVLGSDLPGSHAGWIRVPDADRNLVRVPDPMELEARAVVVADCYAAGDALAIRLRLKRVRRVLVIGTGPSALAFIIAWKKRAPESEKPVAIGSIPGRVMLARRFGATGIIHRPGASAGDRIAALDPRPDAVVLGPKSEGADAEPMAGLGSDELPLYSLDAPGSGWAAEPDRRRLAIRTTTMPGQLELEPLLLTLQDGSPDLLQLVSHTLPLTDAPAAYDWAANGTNGALKILLKA